MKSFKAMNDVGRKKKSFLSESLIILQHETALYRVSVQAERLGVLSTYSGLFWTPPMMALNRLMLNPLSAKNQHLRKDMSQFLQSKPFVFVPIAKKCKTL